MAYGLSTVLFLATWAFQPKNRATQPGGALLFFQFLVELCAEAVVFVASEGYESHHGLLFILTIVSGGIFFGYAGGLVLASFASAIFGAVGFLHLGLSPLAEVLSLPAFSAEAVQTRFFPTTALFFLVSLLSSDGSRRLARMRRELEGAKAALNLAQFSAESMMQDLPTGLLFFDAHHRLRYRNLPAVEILGRELPEGADLDGALRDVLSADALQSILRDRSLGYAGTEASVEGRPVRVLFKPLMRDGVYLGGIFTLFDLTEEKRLGRLLLRQEKMAALGQMSARIAHEIRNPLASISGAAQMLRDAAVASEADQKLLKLIVGESNRLNRFLGDLMDYVRERPPTFRRASLKALIRRLLPLLEKSPAFRSGLVTLEENMENGDVEIVTDQDILMQVLLNVGLNALEAMESRGGTLTVSAARTVDGARIEVSDTGPGMDTAILARAADPFFTTKPQGTGLGLAVCFHVMQTLQGNINLSSVQGRGTVVSLQLPSEPKHGGNLTDGN
jgi:two-component system sensor histidine kinase PilS (NtrC family)